MSKQIYAGNLSYQMSEDSLLELFRQHGEVNSAKIIRDRYTGRSRGFGFVEMLHEGEAENAIKELDGAEVQGRAIKVNYARPRKEDAQREDTKNEEA
jgi:RNA recognition motif-containing protein